MSDEQLFYDRFEALVDKLLAEIPVFATQLGDHRFDPFDPHGAFPADVQRDALHAEDERGRSQDQRDPGQI